MTRSSLALACLLLPLMACGTKPQAVRPAADAPAPVATPAPVPDTAAAPPAFKTILFEYDQAAVADGHREDLRRAVDALLARPAVAVNIEGHCDERGTDEYNLDLGWKRAYAIRDYLQRLGIGDARLFPVSYGRARPAVIGSDESVWRLNRRVEFSVRN